MGMNKCPPLYPTTTLGPSGVWAEPAELHYVSKNDTALA